MLFLLVYIIFHVNELVLKCLQDKYKMYLYLLHVFHCGFTCQLFATCVLIVSVFVSDGCTLLLSRLHTVAYLLAEICSVQLNCQGNRKRMYIFAALNNIVHQDYVCELLNK